VELSVEHAQAGSMHILGYYIDPDHPGLGEQLEAMRQGRDERNLEILDKLRALGLPVDLKSVKARAGGDVIGRPHVAQEMVALGYVESTTEAFDRFLARGQPAYVERKRMTPADAIERIIAAGGVAVLAHPGLIPIPPDALEQEIVRLQGLGLRGLEVLYPEHSAAKTALLSNLARKHRLLETGGTDFHGQAKPKVQLGMLEVPLALLRPLRMSRKKY
jgi:predicted metal-dependent phosphoesterase TrpH